MSGSAINKLLQQIGQGGFGIVWMAEQIEPARRRVTLKIIKLGWTRRRSLRASSTSGRRSR